MNHYPHHIGDFDKATRHLSRIERSIYRDLIEIYYDTEQPLPLDIPYLCRKVLARTPEESTAVEQVLNEYFNRTATGYQHTRCEVELAKYRAINTAKSAAGKASAAARNALKSTPKPAPIQESSTAVEQVLNECATNQEPRTKNQEPVLSLASPLATPNQKVLKGSRLPADWELPEDLGRWAEKERRLSPADVLAMSDRFKDYWISKPGKDGCKLDWPATWRNWVRSDRIMEKRA